MKTKIIQAHTGNDGNWGKFLIGVLTSEWDVIAENWKRINDEIVITPMGVPLLSFIGLSTRHILVLDIQTGEGALFLLNRYGSAKNDLDKHYIWVCPAFEHFLTGLYQQEVTAETLDDLPSHVHLPNAPVSLTGYRRKGKGNRER
jgi:hypothetical protein